MAEKIDLTKQKFEKLTVVKEAGRYKNGDILWECLCKCGNKKVVSGYNLRNKIIKSCGCFKIERTKEVHTTHGMYKTPTYRSWDHMVGRCSNPNSDSYPEYGGRGIIVCDKWLKFEGFFEDMGERPEGMSIDRFPDNNGNYELDNCRWANPTQQALNQRMRRTNKTGVVGVHWDKERQKYSANITVNYKNIALGRFDNFDDAAAIRKQSELTRRGVTK